MTNSTLRRVRCEKCEVKIPKTQPKLRCTICNDIKHLRCQNLTKADAEYIVYLGSAWTCYECISAILPVSACEVTKNRQAILSNQKFKIQCSACRGYCYTPRNARNCEFCDKSVHVKCLNENLGCTMCCEEIIPRFHIYSYELFDDPYFKNDKIYNPYCSSHLTQLIGDAFERENESNDVFNELSEHLINCKYKQAKMMGGATQFGPIPPPKNGKIGIGFNWD